MSHKLTAHENSAAPDNTAAPNGWLPDEELLVNASKKRMWRVWRCREVEMNAMSFATQHKCQTLKHSSSSSGLAERARTSANFWLTNYTHVVDSGVCSVTEDMSSANE